MAVVKRKSYKTLYLTAQAKVEGYKDVACGLQHEISRLRKVLAKGGLKALEKATVASNEGDKVYVDEIEYECVKAWMVSQSRMNPGEDFICGPERLVLWRGRRVTVVPSP